MINLLLAMWPIWVALIATAVVVFVEKNSELDQDIHHALRPLGLSDWDTNELDFDIHVAQAIEITQ